MDKNSQTTLMQISKTKSTEIISQTNTQGQRQRSAEIIERYGNSDSFTGQFNVSLHPLVAKNPDRAYCGTAPRISEVAQAYSEEILNSWLMAQLQNLNEFCGVQKKMTPPQLEELVDFISNEYGSYRITEFMLFIIQMKMGKYGAFYGVIDAQVIMVNLAKFNSLRMEEIARIRTKMDKEDIELKRSEQAKNCITHEEAIRRKKSAMRKTFVELSHKKTFKKHKSTFNTIQNESPQK